MAYAVKTTKPFRRLAIACLGVCLLFSNVVRAGDAANAATPTTSTKDSAVTSTDPDVLGFIKLITGSFATTGDPQLRLNTAVVAMTGVDNAVLFEITRANAPTEPVRLGIMHVYRRQGQLRLRIFDFTGVPTLKEALAGVWAAPEAFWVHALSNLSPRVDMPLRSTPDGYVGQTTEPVPTVRDGAMDMTCVLRVTNDRFEMAERGFDAQGALIWGPPLAPAGAESGSFGPEDRFERSAHPPITGECRQDGLAIIQLVPPSPSAPKLRPGGEISVQYTTYLTDGTRFDSSRLSGRGPLTVRIPDANLIQGWNVGLAGIAKGERRKLIIPPALGFGEKPTGHGKVPAAATLIFDIECLDVKNPPAPPAKPPK